MFFLLVLLLVPAGLAWQLAWTIRHRRLPSCWWSAFFPSEPTITRDGTPLAYWGHVLGLSFAILLLVGFATMLFLSGR